MWRLLKFNNGFSENSEQHRSSEDMRRLPNNRQFGARGGVVGWGTMLQAGRSRVRFPMRPLDISIWPNPSSRTMVLGLTQPLTEMSTRNLPGGKGWGACKADNLTAICEPTAKKMWQPRHLTTLWASPARYREFFYQQFSEDMRSPPTDFRNARKVYRNILLTTIKRSFTSPEM
jgi:hypothetical protein